MSQFTSVDDGIDILDVFLGRVGVVHAQVADAAELARDAEVQADGFRVADVQVAVRLRRKARVNLRIFFLGDVLGHDVADEIGRRRRSGSLFSKLIKILCSVTKGIGRCPLTSRQ